MDRTTGLRASGAGVALTVLVGIAAALLALGKTLGTTEVPDWMPIAMAVAGILGTLLVITFVYFLLVRLRAPRLNS